MRQLKVTKQITNRESISMNIYLTDIGKEIMITPAEEAELAIKIRSGDQNALDKLTRANLRFVVSVAKQYQNQGLSLPDLINEGNLGLIKAASRFDETRGFKFISYAVWWIRQSIMDSLAKCSSIVRMPLNQQGTKNKIKHQAAALEQKLEREPTDEEIHAALLLSHVNLHDVVMLRSHGKHVSLDAPVTEGEETCLLDILQCDDAESNPEFSLLKSTEGKMLLKITKMSLTPRQFDVIHKYYGLEGGEKMTLEEIGEQFELTRERVRQIKENAERKLRASFNSSSNKHLKREFQDN